MNRWSLCVFALALATTAGCLWGDDFSCPDPTTLRVRDGRYRGAFVDGDASVPSTFPAAGAQAEVTVDRDAGTVQSRWTAADGGVVVETWRIRVNP